VTATWRIQTLSCRRLFLLIKATLPHRHIAPDILRPSSNPSIAQLILNHRAYSVPSLGDPCTDHPVTRSNTPAQRTTYRRRFMQAGLLFCLWLVLFTYGDLKIINIYSYSNFLLFRFYLHTSCSVNPHARSTGTITLSYSSPPYGLRNFTQCRNIVSCVWRITSTCVHGAPRHILGYRCCLHAAPLVTVDWGTEGPTKGLCGRQHVTGGKVFAQVVSFSCEERLITTSGCPMLKLCPRSVWLPEPVIQQSIFWMHK